jgi:hypothetical protein
MFLRVPGARFASVGNFESPFSEKQWRALGDDFKTLNIPHGGHLSLSEEVIAQQNQFGGEANVV